MFVLYSFDLKKQTKVIFSEIRPHWLYCMFFIHKKEPTHKNHSSENQTTLALSQMAP